MGEAMTWGQGMLWVLMVAGSYLLGAIPFGLLIGHWVGAGDIRGQGSGNIGATNVLRTAGKLPGAITLLLDMGKGALAVAVAMAWFGNNAPITGLAAVAVFLGHLYPVFLGFKGGKGVATALGVFLAWLPLAGVLTIAVWLLAAAIFRYSSLAAMLAFATLPGWCWWLGGELSLMAATIIAPLVLWRHRGNWQRLMNGNEPRIGRTHEG